MASNIINFTQAKLRLTGKRTQHSSSIHSPTQAHACVATQPESFLDWVLKLLNQIKYRLSHKPLQVKHLVELHYYQAIIPSDYNRHYKISMDELDAIQVTFAINTRAINEPWIDKK